jgi:PBP1b-binding outer membrane lipoprotein LpoB
MKRMGKIIAALMLLALLTAACSTYVCPAYSSNTDQEQADTERS